MSGPHLRPKDLAERWQMSSKTLARWRWAGEGPRFLKVSGKVLYRKEDIREFEAAHLRRRTDEAIAVAAHSLTPKRGQRRKGLVQALAFGTGANECPSRRLQS
jgi:hypothetical protein